MAKVTLYNKNGILKARFYEESEELFSSQIITAENEEVLEFLESLKKLSENIDNIHAENQNLLFKLGELQVVLHNYKDFKKVPELKFIFEKLNNRKFKITREGIKKVGPIVAIGLILLAGGIAMSVHLNKREEENSVDFVIEDEENSIDFVIEDEETSKTDETATITYKEVDTTKPELVTEPTTIDELIEKYGELNIGSMLDDSKAINTRNNFYYLIKLYSEMYNLNPELVLAIATQEKGEHSDIIDPAGGIGLMQIQVSVWNNESISVFNHRENKTEKIYITLDKLKDLEFNIKVGCAIFQDCLKQFDGNVIAALQAYNTGPRAVKQIIDTYARSVGKTRSEVLKENDLGWLDYRTSKYDGDPEYVEHVLRYYSGDKIYLENNGKSKQSKQ